MIKPQRVRIVRKEVGGYDSSLHLVRFHELDKTLSERFRSKSSEKQRQFSSRRKIQVQGRVEVKAIPLPLFSAAIPVQQTSSRINRLTTFRTEHTEVVIQPSKLHQIREHVAKEELPPEINLTNFFIEGRNTGGDLATLFTIRLGTIRQIVGRQKEGGWATEDLGQKDFRHQLRGEQLRNMALQQKNKMFQFMIKNYQSGNTQQISNFLLKLDKFDPSWEIKMQEAVKRKEEELLGHLRELNDSNLALKVELARAQDQCSALQRVFALMELRQEADVQESGESSVRLARVKQLVDQNLQLKASGQVNRGELARLSARIYEIQAEIQVMRDKQFRLNRQIISLTERSIDRDRLAQALQEAKRIILVLENRLAQLRSKAEQLQENLLNKIAELQAKSYVEQALREKGRECEALRSNLLLASSKLQRVQKELVRSASSDQRQLARQEQIGKRLQELRSNIESVPRRFQLKEQMSRTRQQLVQLCNQKVEFLWHEDREKEQLYHELVTILRSRAKIILRNNEQLAQQAADLGKFALACKDSRSSVVQATSKLAGLVDQRLEGLEREGRSATRLGAECGVCSRIVERQKSCWGEMRAAIEQVVRRAESQPVRPLFGSD